MKTAFALLLTAALLASCAPKEKTSTTTTETTTTTGTAATGADTTGTMPTETTGTAATETTGAAATTTPDTAASGTAADSTGTTAEDTTGIPAAGTADTTVTPPITPTTDTTAPSVASSQSMEGTISTSDGTAQTFTMQQDGKDYNVTVTPSTTYQGQATSASDFFGMDRANADVTVEGTPSGSDMAATSITLK